MITTGIERASEALFSTIVTDQLLSTLFQPIVDLDSGATVAYEALSRGPAGTPFHNPAALFAHAHENGQVTELDVACWASSVRTAAEQGFTAPHSLFLNVEPASLRQTGFVDLPLSPAPAVMEVTERALMRDPAGLIFAVDRARAMGYRIALDDLGADPASLALLPLLKPDLIKLDMALLRERPDQDAARVMSAVGAHAERTGTVVLAEGIETEKQLINALALGATYGQGWLFGRPVAEVPDAAELAGIRFAREQILSPTISRTPYEVLAPVRAPRAANRALLVQLSIFLESRARASGDSAVVLSTFQDYSNVTSATRRRYEALGAEAGLVTIYLAGDAHFDAGSKIQVVQIDPLDPLIHEWDIVVLTADFSAVLAAREVDAGNHDEGAYEFVISHDRELATAAALSLLQTR